MGHEFEIKKDMELDATPQQVWEAIATGPGLDSWFMGRNEIEPREGGTTRQDMGDFVGEGTVTSWEPSRRLAYRTPVGEDGAFMAFEYLIEAREGASTVLRFVHSGVLGGDDWEDEYDALTHGDILYLHKLAVYVKNFAGRIATYNMFSPTPDVADGDRVWAAVKEALGLSGPVAEGDKVQLTIEGLAPAEGVVEYVDLPVGMVVRTGDGIYAFIHGMNTVVVEHHNFSSDANGDEIKQAWQGWLTRSFA